jgi:hypothetical protein
MCGAYFVLRSCQLLIYEINSKPFVNSPRIPTVSCSSAIETFLTNIYVEQKEDKYPA